VCEPCVLTVFQAANFPILASGACMIPTILLFVTTFILIAAALIGLGKAIRAHLRYSGKSIVSCPETEKPAAVHVNAAAW